jgi:hypothetical protein
MIPNIPSMIYITYQELRSTESVPVVLHAYPLLVVHALGNFFLQLQPSRMIGCLFLFVLRVFWLYSYIIIASESLSAMKYLLLPIPLHIFRIFEVFHYITLA